MHGHQRRRVDLEKMIFGFVGGLGLFIMGMKVMGDGLQRAAGDRLRKLLEILTRNSFMGVIVGTVTTAIIQSSSATTVMVVGFVNAGLMTLRQAIGVIMGANIGTTVTAQLIAFKLDHYALPAIGIGVLLHYFSKGRNYKYFGQILMGFGLLFLGMTTMSQAMVPLRSSPVFVDLMTGVGRNPLLGVLIGFAFTGIVQSSSATIGVLQALAASGLIGINVALPILFGENIGTCVTAMLSSVGTSVGARRAALTHLIFNIVGALIFMALLPLVARYVVYTSADPVRQIANAHTFFNVANTIIQFPAIGLLHSIVRRLVPGEDFVIERGTKFIDIRLLETPAIALAQADDRLISNVRRREEVINDLEKQIIDYLISLSQRPITEPQSQRINILLNVVNDIERIGDHLENVIEFGIEKKENRLPFSSYAIEELEYMTGKVKYLFGRSLDALETDDMDLARELMPYEDEVDQIEKDLRKSHIRRLHEGKCFTASGVIFLDVINYLERIGDHSTAIARAVLGSL
jgi:phosphate:Na+ symporter